MHLIICGLYLAICLTVLIWTNNRPSLLFTNSRTTTTYVPNKPFKMGYRACLHPLILCVFHWCKQPTGPRVALRCLCGDFHRLRCRASSHATGGAVLTCRLTKNSRTGKRLRTGLHADVTLFWFRSWMYGIKIIQLTGLAARTDPSE